MTQEQQSVIDAAIFDAYKVSVRTILTGAASADGTHEDNAGKEALIVAVADVLYNFNRVANALDRIASATALTASRK